MRMMVDLFKIKDIMQYAEPTVLKFHPDFWPGATPLVAIWLFTRWFSPQGPVFSFPRAHTYQHNGQPAGEKQTPGK